MDQTENTIISSAGSGVQEDASSLRYMRQARWLLENYRNLLDRKVRQEAEIRAAPRYTRSDVIYHLSGFGAVDFKERVQTSSISDPTHDAAVSLDKALQQMNDEALREVSDGYEELCRNIAVVDIAFMGMDSDVRNVAEQLYKEGVPRKKVMAQDGHIYSLKTLRRFDYAAAKCVAMNLIRKARFYHSISLFTEESEDE